MSSVRSDGTAAHSAGVLLGSRPDRAGDGAPRLLPGTAQPPAAVDASFDGASFRFLGARLPFAGETRWRPAGATPLWLSELHSFRWLWTLEGAAGLPLLLDWLQASPAGSAGWEVPATARRLPEWIEWLRSQPGLDAGARARLAAGIARQADWLARRACAGADALEAAVALCWAGTALAGVGAERLLGRGLALLEDELLGDVLPGRVVPGRSPRRQARLVESLLRLSSAAGAAPGRQGQRVAALARAAGERLLRGLSLLVHPDGGYALLDDAAVASAPRLDELAARFGADTLAPGGAWVLPEAGLLGLRASGSCLVLDGGCRAAGRAAGHGGTLGFELSHGGRRLITDTGVSGRVGHDGYERSTAAHSTVEVDGVDLAERRSAVRPWYRPRVERARATDEGDRATLRGAYDVRLDRKRCLRHARAVQSAEGRVDVLDLLEAPDSHRARFRLHLAPGVEPLETGSAVVLADEGRALARVSGAGLEWRAVETPYWPEPAVEQARWTLEAEVPFLGDAELRWSVDLLP